MTHPYDAIEAFALGALDQAEARSVHAHAEQCPTCAILLADAMRTMHAALGDVSTRPSAQLASVKPRRGWQRIPGLLDIAAVAACVALLVWAVEVRSQAGIAADLPVAALVHSHFTHHALRGHPGSAKVLLAVDGSWLFVVADGLRPRGAYDVTATVAARSVPIGSMLADQQGVATGFWRRNSSTIGGVTVTPVPGPGPDRRSELRWP